MRTNKNLKEYQPLIPHRNYLRLLCLSFLWLPGLTPRYVQAETIRVKSAYEAQNAIQQARPGDEILLANGSYKDFKLNLSATGEATRPIIVRAESPGKAILIGQPAIDFTGSYIEVHDLVFNNCELVASKRGIIQFDRGSHCRLTGCLFEHIKPGYYATVNFRNGAKDNRIDHCRFTDIRYRSIIVLVDDNSLCEGPPARNRIDHNLFKDVPPMGKNGAETIQIGQSAIPYADLHTETLVENNLFVHCDGEGEIISVKSTGNTIRHNVFRDCSGEVVNRTGHENVYEGNRFENCIGGIRLSNHGHRVTNNVMIRCKTGIILYHGTPDTQHPAAYLPVYGCVITNNTIVDCAQFGIILGINRNARHEQAFWARAPYFANAVMNCTIAPHENRIAKNIITGSKGVLLKLNETPDNTIMDNLLYATGEAVPGNVIEGFLTGDPGFKDAYEGDYRLSLSSPSLAAGLGAAFNTHTIGPDEE